MSTRETREDDEGTLPLAQRPTAPGKEKPGQLGTIGKGGQAVVRRVRDSKLERDLAMKVMLPQKVSNVDAVRRFVDEARITAQLDHPHVPAVHDLSVDEEGAHYFTMKLVEGETFSDFLSAPGFDATDDEALFRALQILIKVCEGVSFAHSRGVIHCDLKPANVMVGSHGQVYVMDWGISRRLNREPDGAEGSILGTPGYMAPEQAVGARAKLDTRTDVWALGAMLYRIVVGFPPYHAKDGKEGMKLALGGNVFPAEEQARGRPMSKRLLEIALQALSLKPSARHATVEAFQHQLESYVRGAARFPEKTFKKGQVVVREGDPADCAYVILKGRLQASKKVKGVLRPLREMGPGELFGEAAILESQPRTATVTALEETKVSVLSRGSLVEEMGRTDVLSLALTSVLQRFHEAERAEPKQPARKRPSLRKR